MNNDRAIVLCLSCLAASPTAEPAGAESGWLFKQRSLFMGDQTIYVGSRNIRIDNSNMGFTVIGKTGTHTTYFISDKNKTFCAAELTTIGHFISGRVAMMFGEDLDRLPSNWRKVGTVNWNGRKADHWEIETWLPAIHVQGRRVTPPKRRVMTAWLPTDISIEPHLADIALRVCGMPRVPGSRTLPVYGTLTEGTGRPKLGVETYELKRIKLKDELFTTRLTGYKKVSTPEEVCFGGAEQGVLEDMAELLK